MSTLTDGWDGVENRRPPGWDADEAADRIRLRCRRLAELIKRVQVDNPAWPWGEVHTAADGLLRAEGL